MAIADGLAWAVLGLLLAAITVVDLRSQRIPNSLNAALLLTGFAAATLPGGPGVAAAASGAAFGSLTLLGVAIGFRRLRGIDGLGLGDVKFLAGAGAWTGWQGIGPVVLLASTTALLWMSLRGLAGTRPSRLEPFAFGPFLCLAVVAIRVAQRL